MNFNKIDVDGNQNIVIQDINGGKITINVNEHTEIKAFFDQYQNHITEIMELLKTRQEPLLHQFATKIYNIRSINTANFQKAVLSYCHINTENVSLFLDTSQVAQEIFNMSQEAMTIIVVTETENFIQQYIDEIGCKQVLQHYSFALEYWKPYRNEDTILDLLKEFRAKSGYRLKVGFIGNKFPVDLVKWKNHRRKTLIILDLLALSGGKNTDLAKIFDDNDIGGCLLPLDTAHSEQAQQYARAQKQSILGHLCENIGNFHSHCGDIIGGYKGLLQVELEVPNKADLFRRLSNIAHYHLNIKQKFTFNEEVGEI